MIYGQLSDWQRDKKLYPSVFGLAFAFLDGKDPMSLEDGKYPIDGENVFASVQSLTTVPDNERRFESHARYADIQLLLSGREKQLFVPDTAGLVVTENNLAASDVAFHARPAEYSSLLLTSGCFVVYIPGELHCPSCAATETGEGIRKIVFKILWTGK